MAVHKSTRAFNRALKHWVESDVPKTHVLRGIRFMLLEILRRVVFKSPVDTGRFRGNWQVGASIRDGESLRDDPTDDSVTFIARWNRPFTPVFIYNNVPYGAFLENGSSTQAPRGIVAVTLEEVAGLFS